MATKEMYSRIKTDIKAGRLTKTEGLDILAKHCMDDTCNDFYTCEGCYSCEKHCQCIKEEFSPFQPTMLKHLCSSCEDLAIVDVDKRLCQECYFSG